MIHAIVTNLLWTESPWIVALLVVAGCIGWLFYRPAFYGALVLFIFCLYFFRNPERSCLECATDPQVIVCPADGRVVDISYDPQGGLQGYFYKISIFLSPLDVHVNWIPISGTIKEINYVPGAFMMAFLPKSSELNEHNDIIIGRDEKTILVRQIAGTLARRIVCWISSGQEVAVGQKYGMIKFSSRVDIFLPRETEVVIRSGQKVYGGKTILGRLI